MLAGRVTFGYRLEVSSINRICWFQYATKVTRRLVKIDQKSLG
jgi:hypothetical protein